MIPRMYRDMKIAVIIPAYNEESQIRTVVTGLPDFVDDVVIVDDASTDRTSEKVHELIGNSPTRIHLVRHEQNLGTGAARLTGMKKVKQMEADVIALMDGDAQMDPNELTLLLDPVIDKQADYCKGNRLFTGEAWRIIPRDRYFGNAVLSMLTKIVSGYWHVADSQTGYAAMSRAVLNTLDLDRIYTGYGFPNDLLVHLNIFSFRVKDVPVKPIYGVGEKSNIRYWSVVPRLSLLLLKRFFFRMKEKYIIRDFHPLVFFYALSFMLFVLGGMLAARLMMYVVGSIAAGHLYVPQVNLLSCVFVFTMACFSLFFAMWFDMEYGRRER